MKINSSNPITKVAVDLFSGGGGLTQGLKEAGFMVCAAVELDASACETYSANHPETILYQRDIREITGSELLKTSPTGKIDLIAACPPCQGFSSLTAKYKREDERNQLIFDFVRLVKEVRPQTLMMENVPGLANGKGRQLFLLALSEFETLGYRLKYDVLNVADYGIPQHRKRLVVLGGLNKCIDIPPPTHAEWENSSLSPWVTVKETIAELPKPKTMSSRRPIEGDVAANWHITRDLSEINKARLRALRAGQSRAHIPIELRPPCHKKSDHGFSNVYARMSWDAPSPTITGGCTTLSKGRFGHPSQLRTISVYEAALLQTFPSTYKFKTEHMDTVCKLIGNALPPKFAQAMAYQCYRALGE